MGRKRADDPIAEALGHLKLANPSTLIEVTGIKAGTVRHALKRMLERGDIAYHEATGAYYIPNPQQDTIAVPVEIPDRSAA